MQKRIRWVPRQETHKQTLKGVDRGVLCTMPNATAVDIGEPALNTATLTYFA